jgi:hypothetical protein
MASFTQALSQVVNNPARLYKVIFNQHRKQLYYIYEFDWLFDTQYVCVLDAVSNQFLCILANPFVDGEGDSERQRMGQKHTTSCAKTNSCVATGTNQIEAILSIPVIE